MTRAGFGSAQTAKTSTTSAPTAFAAITARRVVIRARRNTSPPGVWLSPTSHGCVMSASQPLRRAPRAPLRRLCNRQASLSARTIRLRSLDQRCEPAFTRQVDPAKRALDCAEEVGIGCERGREAREVQEVLEEEHQLLGHSEAIAREHRELRGDALAKTLEGDVAAAALLDALQLAAQLIEQAPARALDRAEALERSDLRERVALCEPEQVPGHRAALLRREATADAEVHQTEGAIAADQHVPGVQITMKEAVEQRGAQHAADGKREQPLADRRVGELLCGTVVGDPVDVVGHKHPLADELLMRLRDLDVIQPAGVKGACAVAQVQRLQAQIALLQRELGEELHKPRQVRGGKAAVKSLRRRRATPGRRTFTATVRPSCSTARCTCAIDPAASGTVSISAKAARPTSRRSIERMRLKGMRGASSRHQAKALTQSPGSIPSALAMNCPSLMYAGPPRRTSRSAALSAPSSRSLGPRRTPLAPLAARSSSSGASGATERTPSYADFAIAPIVSLQMRGRASRSASRARSARTRSSSPRSSIIARASRVQRSPWCSALRRSRPGERGCEPAAAPECTLALTLTPRPCARALRGDHDHECLRRARAHAGRLALPPHAPARDRMPCRSRAPSPARRSQARPARIAGAAARSPARCPPPPPPGSRGRRTAPRRRAGTARQRPARWPESGRRPCRRPQAHPRSAPRPPPPARRCRAGTGSAPRSARRRPRAAGQAREPARARGAAARWGSAAAAPHG